MGPPFNFFDIKMYLIISFDHVQVNNEIACRHNHVEVIVRGYFGIDGGNISGSSISYFLKIQIYIIKLTDNG